MIWRLVNRIVCCIWGCESITDSCDTCIWCTRPLEEK